MEQKLAKFWWQVTKKQHVVVLFLNISHLLFVFHLPPRQLPSYKFYHHVEQWPQVIMSSHFLRNKKTRCNLMYNQLSLNNQYSYTAIFYSWPFYHNVSILIVNTDNIGWSQRWRTNKSWEAGGQPLKGGEFWEEEGLDCHRGINTVWEPMLRV